MEKGRKRKMENEGEEDEDEQIEKFFALIRSTKDMRDRLKSIPPDGSKEKEEERKAAVWNPKFQPEDFMEDANKSKIPPPTQPAGPSSKTERHQKQEEDEAKEKEEEEEGGGGGSGLDLKLSL